MDTRFRTLDSTRSLLVQCLICSAVMGDDWSVCKRNTTTPGLCTSDGASGSGSLLRPSAFAIAGNGILV